MDRLTLAALILAAVLVNAAPVIAQGTWTIQTTSDRFTDVVPIQVRSDTLIAIHQMSDSSSFLTLPTSSLVAITLRGQSHLFLAGLGGSAVGLGIGALISARALPIGLVAGGVLGIVTGLLLSSEDQYLVLRGMSSEERRRAITHLIEHRDIP